MAREERPHLLIVDDDAAHRLMLATLFEEWGYHIEEAGDGPAALERVRSNAVDIILMDLRMPGMNGIEATRAIHAIDPALPVIVMTAYVSLSSGMEALKAGAIGYLTKPLDFDALKRIVDMVGGRMSAKGEDKEEECVTSGHCQRMQPVA